MKAVSARFTVAAAIIIAVAGCSSAPQKTVRKAPAVVKAPPRGPERIVLLDEPLLFQDEHEPVRTSAVFEFDLPSRPRRARLVLRYRGVPGALSEDYKMGRFRHRVELNARYLMDLNTFSKSENETVSHTKWISVGMLRAHNELAFHAGDDGARDKTPNHDEFELLQVVMEFDW
ncbi:MAG: hypothetical protein D6806_16405 [Deltaproteobacteria bacterium]|nr:MAG: hypothetical protein D6806_16405 [Deltaproteobacteria bacterium]